MSLQNTPILSDAVPRAMPGAEVELGLARSAPLTDGVGSVLDREVDSLPGELIAFIFNN